MTKTVTVTRTFQRAVRVEIGTSNLTVNITSELRIESPGIERNIPMSRVRRFFHVTETKYANPKSGFKYMVIRWYNVTPRPNYWTWGFFISES